MTYLEECQSGRTWHSSNRIFLTPCGRGLRLTRIAHSRFGKPSLSVSRSLLKDIKERMRIYQSHMPREDSFIPPVPPAHWNRP